MTKLHHFSSNFQWQIIESLLTFKRKPKHELRQIWEAICYLTKTGCQWRHLPCNYAPWSTVYWYFRKWTLEGIIEVAHRELRKALRKKNGRKEWASLGIIDSHSVRMSSISGQQRGIDGNKKIKGSKRHIIVDTMGLMICIVAHPANIHDSKGAKEVFDCLYDLRFEEDRLEKILADGGYEGDIAKYLKKKMGIQLELVKRSDSGSWQVIPKRWIVERTFAWLLNYKRLVMDYERTKESAISFVYIAMMILMGKKFN
jgi:putative transposase